MPPDPTDVNRRVLHEGMPLHAESSFYDVESFKRGHPQVEPFEVEELGALGGLRLAHLQCRFGLDTLDLVRMHPTLDATGLDSSSRAVEAAQRLTAEVGLAQRARFVQADIHKAAGVLGRHRFDVVYTGKGALCWLPDLRPWAEQCADLLRPAGWLYVCEFHPVGYCLGEDAPVVSGDYFDTRSQSFEQTGSYPDSDVPTVHNLSYEWAHPLPQVFEALLGAGFELRFFHEWEHTLFQLNHWLVRGDDGRYRWPGPGRLPLMYSLKAQKEA